MTTTKTKIKSKKNSVPVNDISNFFRIHCEGRKAELHKLGAVIGQSDIIRFAKIKRYYDLYDMLLNTHENRDGYVVEDADGYVSDESNLTSLPRFLPSFNSFMKNGEMTGPAVILDSTYLAFKYCNDRENIVFVNIHTNTVHGVVNLFTDKMSHSSLSDIAEFNGEFSKQFAPEGVLVQMKGQKGYSLLINADQDSPDMNVYAANNDLLGRISGATVSFNCIGRFFDSKEGNDGYEGFVEAALDALSDGGLTLLDYTNDSEKVAPKEAVTYFNSHNEADENFSWASRMRQLVLKFPGAVKDGYSFVSGGANGHENDPIRLHRCGYCLFALSNGNRVIFGQDEGTYFGSEFPGEATTVTQALKELKPLEIRNTTGLMRQGEWFLEPVAADDVPHTPQTIAMDLSDAKVGEDEGVILPKDSPDSADHRIESSDQVVVGKDGFVYALNPTLTHMHVDSGDSDHAPVTYSDGWVRFLRNTATRSFSVKGVD